MNNENDLEILKYTCEVKFPLIKSLEIYNPPPEIDDRLDKLMKYSFPSSLEQFTIDWEYFRFK